MKTPKAFYDFSRQFHQDLNLVYPEWAAEFSSVRHEIYDSFRQQFGDQAVRDLDGFFGNLVSVENADVESFWFTESKSDWAISEQGVRLLFQDFRAWAAAI